MLRVIGIAAVVWIGFIVLGTVFTALLWPLLIGAGLLAGAAGYKALKGKADQAAIR